MPLDCTYSIWLSPRYKQCTIGHMYKICLCKLYLLFILVPLHVCRQTHILIITGVFSLVMLSQAFTAATFSLCLLWGLQRVECSSVRCKSGDWLEFVGSIRRNRCTRQNHLRVWQRRFISGFRTETLYYHSSLCTNLQWTEMKFFSGHGVTRAPKHRHKQNISWWDLWGYNHDGLIVDKKTYTAHPGEHCCDVIMQMICHIHKISYHLLFSRNICPRNL